MIRDDELKLCDSHLGRPTPMIFTFAFPGAEYWCPYCGHTGGIFGTGRRVNSTPELEALLAADTVATKDYLRARGTRCAALVKWQEEWIDPRELPDAEKQRLQQIISEWRYPAATHAQ